MNSCADNYTIGFAEPDHFRRARDMFEAVDYTESGIAK